jgi:hypothetical protein
MLFQRALAVVRPAEYLCLASPTTTSNPVASHPRAPPFLTDRCAHLARRASVSALRALAPLPSVLCRSPSPDRSAPKPSPCAAHYERSPTVPTASACSSWSAIAHVMSHAGADWLERRARSGGTPR